MANRTYVNFSRRKTTTPIEKPCKVHLLNNGFSAATAGTRSALSSDFSLIDITGKRQNPAMDGTVAAKKLFPC